MILKLVYSKGDFLSLLFILLSTAQGLGQNFFHAETTHTSDRYGEVQTAQLPDEVIESLNKKKLYPNDWALFFNLKTTAANPAVLGNYSIMGNRVVFKPRFLPDPSVTYLISFSYKSLNQILGTNFNGETITDSVTFSMPDSVRPKIVSISPTLAVFPKNILRIYLNFSSPMSFQNPYDFISIKNDQGEVLTEPFVIVPEGLWNADRTRLTLLFHPGRIKRDVGPNMVEGDIFEIGKRYVLEVSNKWKGANGKSLEKRFLSSFTVADPIVEKIEFNQWRLSTKRGKKDTLFIKTLSPLDQALSKRMLSVGIVDGEILPSKVSFISPLEIAIQYPKQASSKLELLIDPMLEDVCGNTVLNAFDYLIGQKVNSTEILRRGFREE